MELIDKKKLLAEIERRIIEHQESLKKDTTLISETMLKGSLGAYESIKCFITSLQQEQPSEDLGQAAIDAAQLDMQDRQIMEDSHEHRMLYSRVFRRGFKAGAQWQKGQMVKDAAEAEIGYFNQRGLSIRTERSIERMPYDEGDKVKIIIIKED